MTGFEKLVRDMREAQKRYFRDRGMDALRDAKSLERRVDEELERIKRGDRQMTLDFGEAR